MKPPRPESRVETYRRMLALRGYYLDETSKILDFGCGAGSLVIDFRDAGFDAHGFDIWDYLDLRALEDREFFQIVQSNGVDSSEFTFDWDRYRLPYPDATFDFVVSSETMEHVQNYEAVIRELARVLKPGGIAIHTFPSRYRLIEPHTFVPFGGVTKAHWYYRFWAGLGVRSEFQKGLSAREVADLNTRYAHTGTNYLTRDELRKIGSRYFESAYFAPHLWHAASGALGWRTMRPAHRAYTLLTSIVWVLEKPRQAASSRQK